MEPGAQVSAATGAMESVLGKLAGPLADEHENSNGDVRSLRIELEKLHAHLKNMSEVEDPGERARRWLKEVREFSYDVDDCLDDLIPSADDGSGNDPDGLAEKIKIWSRETVAHRRIAEEISASNISKDSTWAEDPRDYTEMPELVGIDGPSAELIKMLDISVQQLKVVSIVGCGGLGKTTLARHVYHTLGEQFRCRAFVSVSRKPDLVVILRNILGQLGCDDQAIPGGDVQLLINGISSFLQDKRYLIIVDDVWDVQTWDIVKYAFPNSSYGGRIITTTRIHEVAKSCCASYGDRVYKLSPLSVVDSEMLLLKAVFHSDEQCPPHLKRVSDMILQKCGGLPLAIISISSLLTANTHEDQWEQAYNSIRHGLGSNPAVERIMRILLLSYFDLTPCLKSCLLYLSIFPENHAIKKEHLVMRWIAEGFIREENGYTLYESGERCFNELINRNLIQPGEINEFGEVETCRVHDDIGGIRALQVLEGINVNSQSTNFVRQLGQLSNLKKLSISFINYYAGDNWKENQEEMVYVICKLGKANLHVLHITINEGADEIFEESWCPAPDSLRELVIKVDILSRVPRWVGSLVNLQKLLIPMWDVGQEDVVILGGLPDLCHLCLTALSAGSKDERLKISRSHGFPSLSHLKIGGEECALGLNFEAGSMPKLQKLELEFDAEETLSLTNGNFDFGIEYLSCLTSTSVRCTYDDESIRPTLEAAMEKGINAHPSHPMLVWMK